MALRESRRARIVDVVGSSAAKAVVFADRWKIASHAATLADLLGNTEVEAVYVATSHSSHEAQALACIAAGKHVLCEKPITLDFASAERVIDAARHAGIFLMEAYMYRCHPIVSALTTRLADGLIG